MFHRHRPAHLFSGSNQVLAPGSSELATQTLSNRVVVADRSETAGRPHIAPRLSATRLVGAGVVIATALSCSVLATDAYAVQATRSVSSPAVTRVVARPAGVAVHAAKQRRPRFAADVLVHDYFHRDVSRGFGSAWVGGRYTLGYNGRVPFSVNPLLHGVVRLEAGSASAALMSVHARDVDVYSTVVTPRLWRITHTIYHAVEARKQVNKDSYRGKVMISRDGRLTVSIARRTDGGEVGLAQRTLPGRVGSRIRVHVELRVAGVSPVVLKLRAWTGTRPPRWQLTTTDAGSHAIVRDGAVGIWDYLCSGCSPTVLRVRSLFARALPSNPRHHGNPGPTPTPTPSPTTSSPAPSATTSSPAPSATTSSPAPSATTTSPAPSATTTSPAPSATTTSPAPSATTTSPAPPPAEPARGSLPIGSAAYPVPGSALFVSPSGSDAAAGTLAAPKRTLAAALKAVAPGQTIVLRGGTYHESDYIPDALSGITIENYPGEAVWFDGSVPVTNWTQNGSTWVSTGWTAQFDHWESFVKGSNAGGFVNPAYPMAAWPDMVFVDGVQLTQVASPSAVVPGSFAVDYNAQTLTIGSDPSGHQLRASDLPKALTVAAMNVTVRGIGFRRYANSLTTGGAIYFARSGDKVENCVLEDMATMGVSMYKSDLDVNHVTVTRTGMLGITGYHADYSTVENSLVTQANDEHFNKAPSSAGMKIVTSTGFTIRNSTFADGYNTHGIWTDISCNHFTIVGNDLYGNGNSPEMQVEESGWGIVANNNVFDGTNGIYVFDSNDIKVYNNTMGHNSSGSVYISQDGRYGSTYWATNPNPIPSVPWQVQNIDVYNNEFQYNGGPYGFQVWALDTTTHIAASDMNITIQGNLFHAHSSTSDTMVGWGGTQGKVVQYQTPSTLDTALGVNWTNTQSSGNDVTPALSSATVNAVPLPSDVAAAMNVPTGTKMIGSARRQ